MLSSMGIVPRLRSVVNIGTMEYSLVPTEQGTMRACCGHMRFLQKEGALEDQRLCFNSTLHIYTPEARVLSDQPQGTACREGNGEDI
jgi:hypothetical protein